MSVGDKVPPGPVVASSVAAAARSDADAAGVAGDETGAIEAAAGGFADAGLVEPACAAAL